MRCILLLILTLISGNSLYAQDSLATVHFYRANTAGYAVSFTLYQDTVKIGKLNVGNVLTVRCNPGTVKFSAKTESERSIVLHTKPGLTYFVECKIASGAIVGVPTFRQVPIAQAKKDLTSINSYLAQLFTPGMVETIEPSDTLRALNNLFERKRKGGKTLATIFGVYSVAAIAAIAGSGDAASGAPALVVGVALIITGASKAKRFNDVALDTIQEEYKAGKPLPPKIKAKFKAKDFL